MPPNDFAAAPLDPPQALELSLDQRLAARAMIVEKLVDLVSWPASRIPIFERQLAADILLGLMRTTGAALRKRCAEGLVGIVEPPKALLRYLARDEIQVSRDLLENGAGFDDSDLIATVRSGVAAHWLAIAKRRAVSEAVTDALIQTGDPATIEAVLRNGGARLSMTGVDLAVLRSKQAPALSQQLLTRAELRPNQALLMFWWSDADCRAHIFKRFAADRNVLIQEMSPVFKLAAQEDWSDAEARKALQLIERRQRNRAAAERSPLGSLENAAERAERGLDQPLMDEIAYLAGIRPKTATQIFSDPGGEPIAVLAKATGLKRGAIAQFWRGLGRPFSEPDDMATPFGRTMLTFETLPNAKAQTVLRYWNWSFTAEAAAPAEPISEAMEFAPARRNAALLSRARDP